MKKYKFKFEYETTSNCGQKSIESIIIKANGFLDARDKINHYLSPQVKFISLQMLPTLEDIFSVDEMADQAKDQAKYGEE